MSRVRSASTNSNACANNPTVASRGNRSPWRSRSLIALELIPALLANSS